MPADPLTLHDTVHDLAQKVIDAARAIQADTFPTDVTILRRDFDQRPARQHTSIAAGYVSALLHVLDVELHTIYLEDQGLIGDENGRQVLSWMGLRMVLPRPKATVQQASADARVTSLEKALRAIAELTEVEAGASVIDKVRELRADLVSVTADRNAAWKTRDELTLEMAKVNARAANLTQQVATLRGTDDLWPADLGLTLSWGKLLDRVRRQRAIAETPPWFADVGEALGHPVAHWSDAIRAIKAVVHDRMRFKADADSACHQVAQMFHAVTGTPWGDGPKRGVLEDVADAVAEWKRRVLEAEQLSAERYRDIDARLAASSEMGEARHRCIDRDITALRDRVAKLERAEPTMQTNTCGEGPATQPAGPSSKYPHGYRTPLDKSPASNIPGHGEDVSTWAQPPAASYPQETDMQRDRATNLTAMFLDWIRTYLSEHDRPTLRLGNVERELAMVARSALGDSGIAALVRCLHGARTGGR